MNTPLINTVLSLLFIVTSGFLFTEVPTPFLAILAGLSFLNLFLGKFWRCFLKV
tara:strand:- start:23 stop:184 length:162 start_codon:yes stop_codon:yes gene_type:complete